MKRVTSLLLVIPLTNIAVAQELNAKETIVSLMETAVKKEEVIGISAGVLTADEKIWHYSYGYSDKKNKVSFSSQTINRTASITKPITAVAIMQLVEQNKLVLDAPVSQYLSQFNTKKLDAITVRQVLQHTSGLSGYKNKKEAANKIQYNSFTHSLSIIIDRELLFDPGSDFYYTSYGYGVLGMLIEKVSGLSYEEYLKEFIFEPAGMENSSIEKFGEEISGKSLVYHQKKPGKITTITTNNLSDRRAGGGVQSTVEDLLKFGQAVLSNTLITKESFLEMIKDHGLKKQGNGYGMGWYLYGNHPERGNVVGHNGEQYGCSSFLFLFPDKGIVTTVLSNTSRFNGYAAIGIKLYNVAEELK